MQIICSSAKRHRSHPLHVQTNHFRELREALSNNPPIVNNSSKSVAQLITESDDRLVGWVGSLYDLSRSKYRCQLVSLNLPPTYETFSSADGYIYRKTLHRNVTKRLNDALVQLRPYAELVCKCFYCGYVVRDPE